MFTRTIARYFDTFYDRIMAAEISGTQQILPFPLVLKSLGRPADSRRTSGYVDFDRPDSRPIIENAKRMTSSGTASPRSSFTPSSPSSI